MAARLVEAPSFAVLKVAGINRDFATQAALQAAGAGIVDIVHIRAFTEGDIDLNKYQGLIIPGGFSYGDDIQSGVVLALEMRRMQVELEEFAFYRKHPIVGICNGFQALVHSGLLPFGEMTTREHLQATLTTNERGRFESRWITIVAGESKCPFVPEGQTATIPVAHGEGNFVATPEALARIKAQGQVVYRYVDSQGKPTQEYPANPNGSIHAIAGICDPISGTVLGLMPHHEDYIRREHRPNWRRGNGDGELDGLEFYKQVVLYAREM